MEVGGSPEEGGVCGGWVGETQTGEENGLEAIIDCWDCVQEEPGLSLARSLSFSLSLSLTEFEYWGFEPEALL